MNDYRILVVDDEGDLCEILKFNPENESYEVDTANSIEEALKMDISSYHLILLDVMMGGISGFKTANMLKKDKRTVRVPIIFITARDTENDTITDFNLRADDYISRPFSLREVIARVKAIPKRTATMEAEKVPERLTYQLLAIDITKKKVSTDDEEVQLMKKEFETLLLLTQNKGRVFSYEDILTHTWNDEVYVLDRTVDMDVTRLRKKINEYSKYIVTRLEYGYCSEVEQPRSMNLPVEQKHFLSLDRKLFLSMTSLFLVFAFRFVAYQYQREREYKVELLNTQLQNYNNRLYERLNSDPAVGKTTEKYIRGHALEDLRVTLTGLQGNTIYDSYQITDQQLESHLNRPEMQKALEDGTGLDVRHTLETTGLPYSYSVTHYGGYITCSALPYNIGLINSLRADPHYLQFTVVASPLPMVIFYKLTNKLGTSISQLREFAMRADRNESIEMATQSTFPYNELGEISQHIAQIYKHLHETKEIFYIEHEKPITHLQISRERLSTFTRDKKGILVNDFFIRYDNLISNSNLGTTEEVFAINELKGTIHFIDESQQQHSRGKDEKHMSIIINKNGRIFIMERIISQDASFRVSINDITQEEEQARLKRQLAQNIAHELKAPVSSIQGYLETIVNNENISRDKIDTFLERCYAQSNCPSRLPCDISVLTCMDEVISMIDMGWVNISILTRNIINEAFLELEEKCIGIVDSLKEGIRIKGNYSLLYPIFRNLMDNAVVYVGTNIQINISCLHEDENYYYFSFVDTGIGVSLEYLNHLFKRFYRMDKGHSRKLGGTGLGLTTVKDVVIIHGGSASAKNSQGGGLEFAFTLAKEK